MVALIDKAFGVLLALIYDAMLHLLRSASGLGRYETPCRSSCRCLRHEGQDVRRVSGGKSVDRALRAL